MFSQLKKTLTVCFLTTLLNIFFFPLQEGQKGNFLVYVEYLKVVTFPLDYKECHENVYNCPIRKNSQVFELLVTFPLVLPKEVRKTAFIVVNIEY